MRKYITLTANRFTMDSALALFDFDGTLTRKDTLWGIIQFIHGRRKFYLGMIQLSPYLFLYKIKVIPNWKAKEKVLTFFFKEMTYDVFQNYCDRFASEKIPNLLRKDAVIKLNQLMEEGARIMIVTASVENWVLPWCRSLNMECIASIMEVHNGKLTGKLLGKNCHGIEKVNRIRETIDLSQYSVIYAFGDSKGDLPMLKLATKAYYRAFED